MFIEHPLRDEDLRGTECGKESESPKCESPPTSSRRGSKALQKFLEKIDRSLKCLWISRSVEGYDGLIHLMSFPEQIIG